MMKRFMATLVALIMSFVAVTPAFASETGEIDYLNYQFPDDAVVIYQSEDGVVYQSKGSPASVTGTSSMQYNGVWLNAGNNSMGSFSIKPGDVHHLSKLLYFCLDFLWTFPSLSRIGKK